MASGHAKLREERKKAYRQTFKDLGALRFKLERPNITYEWDGVMTDSGEIEIRFKIGPKSKKILRQILENYKPPAPRGQKRDVPAQQRQALLDALDNDVEIFAPSKLLQLIKILDAGKFRTAPQGYDSLLVSEVGSDEWFSHKGGVLETGNQLPSKAHVSPRTAVRHAFGTSLSHAMNLVLEGVPGTGKTYAINDLKTAKLGAFGEGARPLSGVSTRFMTMHPSTSYEDFVEGLRPAGAWTNATAAKKVTDGKSTDQLPGPWFHEKTSSTTKNFALKNGFFVEACVAAVADPNKAVVVVLDELNRCNIPKVLGDLMTVIEESKRAHWDGSAWVVDSDAKAVTLPYSGRKLFVPDNLFIIGTMNTTDRSVAPMDAALRRRFAFHRIWPQGFGPDAAMTGPELLKRLGVAPAMTRSLALWKAINTLLLAKYGADAMLGHSYLDDLSRALSQKDANATEVVAYHWSYRILPQLMDVIASNGLTRSLVTNPQRFFGDENTQDIKKPGTYPVLEGKLLVDIAGEGSLQSAAIRWPADS